MQVIIAYYIILNILAFFIMGIDKYKAIHHNFRINEFSLIVTSFLGGAFGGWLGMICFHHKTKKKKFAIGIPFFAFCHVLLLIYLMQYIR